MTETYRQWFEHGKAAGGADNLETTLGKLGHNLNTVIAEAGSDGIAEAYRDATQEARNRGIFGAPSFVVDGELFWGDDRLEDALSWHKTGRVA